MSDVIVSSSRARMRWPVRRRGRPANSCDGPEVTPVDRGVARVCVELCPIICSGLAFLHRISRGMARRSTSRKQPERRLRVWLARLAICSSPCRSSFRRRMAKTRKCAASGLLRSSKRRGKCVSDFAGDWCLLGASSLQERVESGCETRLDDDERARSSGMVVILHLHL